MTRKELYDLVNTVCPAYWIGQHTGECLSTYAVIKYKNQTNSISNGTAGWQYIDIMIYVPNTSLSGMDEMLVRIKNILMVAGLEPTGNITPDWLDTDKKAFMRSEEYRIPKQIINQ